ncbi:MAG: efflux RND transporter permease subunit [Phycisphaerales bacterium]|nr:efflux RND transporter permease subunit [Phycisphaerales bacterium]
MSRFFIDRPIFASSIAILMVVVGLVAIKTLPIAQWPEIVPPTVSVSAGYAGASAEVTSRVVTTPLEQQINGVEGMIYMSSNSTANGSSSITVTFEVGYDIDTAAVDVQNRVSTAQATLPEVTQRSGVTVRKQSPNITLIVNLVDETGTYDSGFLTNWAQIYMADALLRQPGVGSLVNFGLLEYSVRVWLDPDKMAAMGVSALEVSDAVNTQNYDYAIGQIGAPPLPGAVPFQFQLVTLGQLRDIEEFEEIVVRVGEDGSIVQIRDIGRVELGSKDYQTTSLLNNAPTATLGIFQSPGANAVQVSTSVEKFLEDMKSRMPPGVKAVVTYDTTEFIDASMEELVITLLEAIGLVILVVFVFLQSWRTTIIPIIAIPVSLVATFAVLAAFGFSINTLTLLGLVLAVGLVVDDAIVVVENVERQLEDGLGRRAASVQAMKEVTPPIMATTIVLMAVFVPTAFMPGITGQLYNQFALTIAFSMGLSAFNSLSLSPALSGVILKHTSREDRILPFRVFNNAFDATATHYSKMIGFFGRKIWWVILLIFAGLLLLTFNRVANTPTGFVPEEDQGWFFVMVDLPGGATLDRCEQVTYEVTNILKENPAVENCVAVSGYNFLDGFSETSAGVVFGILKPWSERTTPESQVPNILKIFDAELESRITAGLAVCINPPPIPGLGSTGGFQFEIQDLLSKGPDELEKITRQFMAEAEKQTAVGKLLTDYQTGVPMLELDIDRVEAERLGVSLQTLFQSLNIYLGSYYVNNWNQYNQVYQVIVQAEGSSRMTIPDIGRIRIPNRDGDQIPLAQFVKVKPVNAPDNIPHYNIYNSAQVIGGPKPGYSGGQAIKQLDEVSKQVLEPSGFMGVWTGTVYQQIQAGNLAPYIFGLSLIIVFLVLAALYESWTLPFVILLGVPLAILGAVLALGIRGIPLDIYGQIGLLMLVGLAAKNAILIVEFAKSLREGGAGILEAAMESSRLRLRPILMTAFAFILGILPLVVATGAGAAARHSIGTVVLGGMIASTLLSLLIVPVLYVVVEYLREHVWGKQAAESVEQVSEDREHEGGTDTPPSGSL